MTPGKQIKMAGLKSMLFKYFPVILGALYLITDANQVDYEYAWDHSVYPPFTGKKKTKYEDVFISISL